METLLSEDVVSQLLQYPILVLVIVVIWFGHRNLSILGKIIEKIIEKMGKKGE